MERLTIAPNIETLDAPPTNSWLKTVEMRLNVYSGTTNPLLVDVPANQWVVFNNTVLGETRIWTNIGGVLKNSELLQTTPLVLPTFANGWVNYGLSYGDARYRRDSSGRVFLEGLVKSGTIGAKIYTLDAGYRPLATVSFPVVSNGAFALVEVGATGDVVCYSGSNIYVSLSGISFTTT